MPWEEMIDAASYDGSMIEDTESASFTITVTPHLVRFVIAARHRRRTLYQKLASQSLINA